MKRFMGIFLLAGLPAVFSAVEPQSNGAVTDLLADPVKWTSWAARPEIAPEFALESSSHMDRRPVLTIRARGNVDACGCWFQELPTLRQGRRYRIAVAFKVRGVEHIGHSVWAILGNGVREFQELDHEGERDGLRRMSMEISPESDFSGLSLRLYLAWAPEGWIRWVSATLADITDQPAARRVVKLAAISGQFGFKRNPPSSLSENLRFYEDRLDAVGAQRVDLVCLPETVNTERIPGDPSDLAEPIPGGAIFRGIAAKAQQHRMYVAVSLLEREGVRIYNTGVLIDREGKIVGKYRKTHPTVAEALLLGITPGDTYPVFDTDFGRVGYMTCFDNHYPEVSRILSVKGAEVLVFSNNSDGREGGSLWEPYMRTRALDNQVHIVAAVSRLGQTCIVSPRGEIIAQATETAGSIAVAKCDLSIRVRNGTGRQIEARYMRVRRADTFAPLLRAYGDREPPAAKDFSN